MPFNTTRLLMHEAAALCGYSTSQFLKFYRDGLLDTKGGSYAQRDYADKRLYIHRGDIPDIKSLLKKRMPTEAIVEHVNPVYTNKQVCELLTLGGNQLVKLRTQLGIAPVRGKNNKLTYTQADVDRLKALKKQNSYKHPIPNGFYTATQVQAMLKLAGDDFITLRRNLDISGQKQGGRLLFTKAEVEALRQAWAAQRQSAPRSAPLPVAVKDKEYLSIPEIAKALGCHFSMVYARRQRGDWPLAFKPVRKGSGLAYPRAIVEALRDWKPEQPQEAVVVAPVTSPQTAPIDYKDLAIDLLEHGFKDAAIYVLKTKC